MTREERLAYQRGYAAGVHGRWPEHKPPRPPDEEYRKLMDAANALRNSVDGWLGQFDEDDPLHADVGKYIDALDQVMIGLFEWVKS